MALTIPRTFSGSASARQSQVADLLRQATTTAEINQILTAARSSNTTIDNAAVSAANARITAAAKPAPAPATAPATAPKPAAAPAPAAVKPPASLNLPDAATAMRLIVSRDPKAPPTMKTDSTTGTQYYLIPPAGNRPAEWATVPRGGTVASNGQSLQQINTNQTAYITANATPLPKATPAAAAPAAATPARPTLSVAQQSTIQQPILSQLQSAGTQADFDRLVRQAADAGAPLNSGQINSFQTALTQRLAKGTSPPAAAPAPAVPGAPVSPTAPRLTAAQQSTIQQPILEQLRGAGTQADFDRLVQQAADAGAPLNAGIVSSFQTALSQRMAAPAAPVAPGLPPPPATPRLTAQQISDIQQPILRSLGQVNSQAEFDNLVQQAAAAGAPINPGILGGFQTSLQQRQARTEQERVAGLQQPYLQRLTEAVRANDQASFDRVLGEAQAAGITLPQQQVEANQNTLRSNLGVIEQQRIQGLQAGFAEQLRSAVAANDPAAVDRVVAQATAAGAALPASQIEAARGTLQNNQRVLVEQQRQQLASQLGEQLRGVTSLGDIDQVIEQARSQGITIPQAQIDQARGLVQRYSEQAGEIADLVKSGFTGTRFTKSGAELVSVPADPVTGQPGGVFMVSGGGLQRVGADGRVTGPVQSADQFNEMRRTVEANTQRFATDQAEARRIADLKTLVERFEADLPKPGSERFNYLLANRFVMQGPDGRSYELVGKNEKTGDAAHWIVSVDPNANFNDPAANFRRLDNPDAVVQKGVINQQFTTNAEVQRARALEARAEQAAADRRKGDINVGEMTRFIAGTLAVFGGAMLLANYGPAMYDKIVESIATMAEGGSSAGEIADVLSNVYDLPTELASNLGEVATGAVEEAITTIPGVQPPPGYENVFEFGFPEAAGPAVPATPPVAPPVGPESVFEFGFPEAPVAPPTPTPPVGPESVFEYGFPEAPVTPGPTPPVDLPPAIEYPGIETPLPEPVQVAQGPGPATDAPLRIEITGLPEQTPIPEGLDYPDLGPPDYVYEPTIEPSPFGEPGPAPVEPGIPTAPPGPETVFEYGFPETPVPPTVPALPGPGTTFEFGFPETPTLPGVPTTPTVPGPDTTFEFGFPETPVGPSTPPTGPSGPAVPGPDTTFEFGYPETPVGPPTPPTGPGGPAVPGPDTTFEFGYPEVPATPTPTPLPPGPDTVFEYGFPETPTPLPPGPDTVFEYGYPEPPPEPPPYDYIDSSTVVPEPVQPPYDYIDSSTVVPDRSIVDTIIDTIRTIPTPPIIPIIPIAPTPPGPRTYPPLPPVNFGNVGNINLPGVNPGFFTTTSPYYQTTSPVQSRYSWRQRPLQTGTEYSAALYNAPGVGPAQPFGLREMFTDTDINQYLAALAGGGQPTGAGRR